MEFLRRTTKKSRWAGDSESWKWIRVATAAEEAVGGRAQVVHLMDREADIYDLLASLVERGSRFVIRAGQNRNAEDKDGPGKMFDLLEGGREVVTRNVPLSRRLPRCTVICVQLGDRYPPVRCLQNERRRQDRA